MKGSGSYRNWIGIGSQTTFESYLVDKNYWFWISICKGPAEGHPYNSTIIMTSLLGRVDFSKSEKY
jgi:hypothetical protein